MLAACPGAALLELRPCAYDQMESIAFLRRFLAARDSTLTMFGVETEGQGLRNAATPCLATHSPVLAACPGAALLELRHGELRPCTYDQLESIAFLRRFLAARDSTLTMFGVETEG